MGFMDGLLAGYKTVHNIRQQDELADLQKQISQAKLDEFYADAATREQERQLRQLTTQTKVTDLTSQKELEQLFAQVPLQGVDGANRSQSDVWADVLANAQNSPNPRVRLGAQANFQKAIAQDATATGVFDPVQGLSMLQRGGLADRNIVMVPTQGGDFAVYAKGRDGQAFGDPQLIVPKAYAGGYIRDLATNTNATQQVFGKQQAAAARDQQITDRTLAQQALREAGAQALERYRAQNRLDLGKQQDKAKYDLKLLEIRGQLERSMLDGTQRETIAKLNNEAKYGPDTGTSPVDAAKALVTGVAPAASAGVGAPVLDIETIYADPSRDADLVPGAGDPFSAFGQSQRRLDTVPVYGPSPSASSSPLTPASAGAAVYGGARVDPGQLARPNIQTSGTITAGSILEKLFGNSDPQAQLRAQLGAEIRANIGTMNRDQAMTILRQYGTVLDPIDVDLLSRVR
jgi:hypothetical protein